MAYQNSLYAVDQRRQDGLKSTSLSVLEQRRQHKTGMQKTFQQYNQRMLESTSSNSIYQQNMGSQEIFHAPRHQSITSHRTHSFSSQMAPPQIPVNSQSMSPNGPLLHQGQWNNQNYAHEYQMHDSPSVSQGEWATDDEMMDTHARLERLLVLEEENMQLREMNKQLREDNNMLLGHIQDDTRENAIEQMEEQVEAKQEEVQKLNRVRQELEQQVMDLIDNMTKLKLISKTIQDKKDKEISSLREDIDALEKELDNAIEEKSNTRDTTPINSPLSTSSKDDMVTKTPPVNSAATFTSPFQGKKELKDQLNTTMKDDLVQDLVYTIRSLKSDCAILKSEKQLLMKNGEKDKRMIKLLAATRSHQVKIRRGLTIVSHVDTLI